MKLSASFPARLTTLFLLALTAHAAIKPANPRTKTKQRNLKGVNLVSKSLSDRHTPTRYLKLQKFMQEYSKKAGVELDMNPSGKRKLSLSKIFSFLGLGYKTVYFFGWGISCLGRFWEKLSLRKQFFVNFLL